MFFITILATAYAITASLRQSQLKSQLALKAEYESDIDNVNEIAKQLATTGNVGISDEELEEKILQILSTQISDYTTTIQTLKSQIEELEYSQEYHVGDTYEGPDFYLCEAGFVSDDKRDIVFSISLPKNIGSDVTSIEFSTTAFNIRHIGGGYLIFSAANENSNLSAYFAIDEFKGNVIVFHLNDYTAFNTTNNTPTSIALDGLKITFK